MPKLKRMKVRAVALVDKGANRREFFLIKSQKGGIVNKELVIEILKSAKDLSEERVNELIALVPEADRDEVTAIAKAADGTESEDDVEIEKLIEKVGAKFSKATADQLKVLQDHFSAMQTLLEEFVNGLKEPEAELDPEAVPAEKAEEDDKAMQEAAAAEAESVVEEEVDVEVSEEELKKQIDEALQNAVPEEMNN